MIKIIFFMFVKGLLTRIFHELLSRDHKDGHATWESQGVGSEAYLSGTSQEATPEDARKDAHIRGRSKLFMKCPGYTEQVLFCSFVSRVYLQGFLQIPNTLHFVTLQILDHCQIEIGLV